MVISLFSPPSFLFSLFLYLISLSLELLTTFHNMHNTIFYCLYLIYVKYCMICMTYSTFQIKYVEKKSQTFFPSYSFSRMFDHHCTIWSAGCFHINWWKSQFPLCSQKIKISRERDLWCFKWFRSKSWSNIKHKYNVYTKPPVHINQEWKVKQETSCFLQFLQPELKNRFIFKAVSFFFFKRWEMVLFYVF